MNFKHIIFIRLKLHYTTINLAIKNKMQDSFNSLISFISKTENNALQVEISVRYNCLQCFRSVVVTPSFKSFFDIFYNNRTYKKLQWRSTADFVGVRFTKSFVFLLCFINGCLSCKCLSFLAVTLSICFQQMR